MLVPLRAAVAGPGVWLGSIVDGCPGSSSIRAVLAAQIAITLCLAVWSIGNPVIVWSSREMRIGFSGSDWVGISLTLL